MLENDLMHIDPSPNIEGEDDMTDKPGLQNFNTKPILLGADVEALYPNMERTATGGMIYQAVLESDISFQGINYELLAIYLFLVMGRNLGPLKIQNGIPFREMELKSEMERHFLFGTSKCHVLH